MALRFNSLLCAVFLLALVSFMPPSNAADLRSFERAYGNTLYPYPNDNQKAAIRRELGLIKAGLKSVPESQRSKVLARLTRQTTWGSPERATACLVSAWYGADYIRSRDYLLNAFFWGVRGFDQGPGKPFPFEWAEDTVRLLYKVYEKNYDFRLLHDLLTGCADGAGATAISYLGVDAAKDHPRGILHISSMSRVGRSIALIALSKYPDGSFGECDEKHNAPAKRVFRAYTIRVASDPADPLQKTAAGLLKESAAMDKKRSAIGKRC